MKNWYSEIASISNSISSVASGNPDALIQNPGPILSQKDLRKKTLMPSKILAPSFRKKTFGTQPISLEDLDDQNSTWANNLGANNLGRFSGKTILEYRILFPLLYSFPQGLLKNYYYSPWSFKELGFLVLIVAENDLGHHGSRAESKCGHILRSD